MPYLCLLSFPLWVLRFFFFFFSFHSTHDITACPSAAPSPGASLHKTFHTPSRQYGSLAREFTNNFILWTLLMGRSQKSAFYHFSVSLGVSFMNTIVPFTKYFTVTYVCKKRQLISLKVFEHSYEHHFCETKRLPKLCCHGYHVVVGLQGEKRKQCLRP